ncbi:MAG: cryptochrome/photolyase family protein [Desulfobacterales bacterium]
MRGRVKNPPGARGEPAPATHAVRLVLGDQLNPAHSWFSRPDPGVLYVLMEVRQETDYVKHHVQKVAAFFAAMRAFARHLAARGHRVEYIPLDDPRNTQRIPENLRRILARERAGRFEYLLPDELRLDRELARFAAALDIPAAAHDTEHFLTGRAELSRFFRGGRRFLLESFYRHLRRRFAILLSPDGRPAGGAWNFDRENRRPYDGRVPVPAPLLFENDVRPILATIRDCGVRTFGEIDPARLPWPVDRGQAERLLAHFIEKGLPRFGTYQDAMSLEHWALFHSRLSFALNVKLLHPREVIRAAVDAHEADPARVGIAQVEGFVRQILGWREYMRGVYWALMPELEKMNALGHDRPLPAFYWTGETGMRCVAAVVRQSLERAWAHHIQRLMVTGNFALLAGVHPDEVDAWYLGIYIDAIQWVELPNTRAMSQFADGGRVATKPYVSAANYLRRMSDYCDACRYDPARRTGGEACPFNALYWDFFSRHRGKLARNPRLSLVYRSLDRMAPAERRALLAHAASLRERLEGL